jgi:carbon dioxide concentrating mechanism protein CcmN
MHALPPVPIDDRHLYLSGEVVVHESAVIAPGVLLQADPGSRITIEAGVCIGSGSILHAHRGSLTLEAGAIIGNGVLLIGRGTIGHHACIGAFSTIMSCSVAAQQLVPPHSLLGDQSRSIELVTPSTIETNGSADPPSTTPETSATSNRGFRSGASFRAGMAVQPSPAAETGSGFRPESSMPPFSSSEPSPPQPANPSVNPSANSADPPRVSGSGASVGATTQAAPPAPIGDAAPPSPPTEPPPRKALTQVYGQAYVERIMITMFPHRRSLDSDPDRSESELPNPPP